MTFFISEPVLYSLRWTIQTVAILWLFSNLKCIKMSCINTCLKQPRLLTKLGLYWCFPKSVQVRSIFPAISIPYNIYVRFVEDLKSFSSLSFERFVVY